MPIFYRKYRHSLASFKHSFLKQLSEEPVRRNEQRCKGKILAAEHNCSLSQLVAVHGR